MVEGAYQMYMAPKIYKVIILLLSIVNILIYTAAVGGI
mgnify:CR=1 FL=1